MWRVLLVLTVVAALGMVAVEAGGFSTSTEDITSFSTSTSLTVPCEPTALPDRLWVRGPVSSSPGSLDLIGPTVLDSPSVRRVENFHGDAGDVDVQADPDFYVTWASPPAPPCGYRLSGTVTLLIDQDGHRNHRLTAGLFSCPAAAPAHTTVPSCRYITSNQANQVASSDQSDADGFLVRTVPFGALADTIIPEGEQLRLKVVNLKGGRGPIEGGGSTADWNLKWGYRSDRQSQLVITP